MTHRSNIWHKWAKCTQRWGHGRAGPRRSLSGNSCLASRWESVRALSQHPHCLELAPGVQTLQITGDLAQEASENVIAANTSEQLHTNKCKKPTPRTQGMKELRKQIYIAVVTEMCPYYITWLSLTFWRPQLVVWVTFRGGGEVPLNFDRMLTRKRKGTRSVIGTSCITNQVQCAALRILKPHAAPIRSERLQMADYQTLCSPTFEMTVYCCCAMTTTINISASW